MPSNPSALGGLELQTTGEGINAWGGKLNALFTQLTEYIASFLPLTITGDVTLTADQYLSNQFRRAGLFLTGSPTAGFAVIVPAQSKGTWIINGTGQIATVKTASGTGAAVRPGRTTYVICDGTNCFAADPTLDQIAKPVASIDMNGQRGINQAAGIAATDSATLTNRISDFQPAGADVSFGNYRGINVADGAAGSQMAASVAQVERLINNGTSATFPVQTGHANEVLSTDGTTPGFAPIGRLRDTHDFFVAGWN